jgi:nucleotidyltransferase substrate binding protein (TIGR01987 family)
MTPKDRERFQKSLDNLGKALMALRRSIEAPVTEPRDLSGIIKDFEIVYELSWKTLQKFLEDQGHSSGTAREAIKVAYQRGVTSDEETWLEILNDRNLTVHTYNEKLAADMVERIKDRYVVVFSRLYDRLRS